MLRLNSEILIGKYKFTYVNNVTIRKSFENYTQTATISIPNILRENNKYIIDEFSEGDSVEIKLGYYPNLETRFLGYVTKKVSGSIAVFECEDRSWLLKKQGLSEYSKTNISLQTLIKDNFDGAFECNEANVGDWQIGEGSTLIQLFEQLREFGFFCYFDENEVLQVKSKSTIINETLHEFSFQRNIIEGSELKYFNANEARIISYGISKQTNGSLIQSYAYYDENNKIKVTNVKPVGTLNKFATPNQTQDDLDKLVVRRLPNLYHTGTLGNIVVFGEPALKIGDRVQLTDDRYSDKNGVYSTKEIEITFGDGGYRQRIEIDTKLS